VHREIGRVNVCTVMGGRPYVYCVADEGSTNGMPPTVATLLASTDAADTGDFAVCKPPSPGTAGTPLRIWQLAQQPQSSRHIMLRPCCM
jgi:hypothetical protein